jgi:hypothetical protein
MDIYAQIAIKIIESQEAIIGPVAIEQAERVNNLKVDWANHQVSVGGSNRAAVIDDLVKQYKDLFGKISVEVCREAAARYLTDMPAGEQPKLLA